MKNREDVQHKNNNEITDLGDKFIDFLKLD